MAVFTVGQGKRYRAEISLRFFERIVSNETIESRLREAGFTDVRVGGSGATRHAEALLARARHDRGDAGADCINCRPSSKR